MKRSITAVWSSNGLTSARHDVFAGYLAGKYPESFDAATPAELVYSGSVRLTDPTEVDGVDAGKLVLSPTRTYAPVVKALLDEMRPRIKGMIHCSGGAQTKILHFLAPGLHVVKDNLLPVPPLFTLIQRESSTDWAEMYKVFNMGTRMEIYVNPDDAGRVIEIAQGFGIPAQIIGRVEKASEGDPSLTITGPYGTFTY